MEVLDARTETDALWVNPDGTFTRETYTAPVRVRDASGDLVDVDATLVKDSTGVHPRAVPFPVRFSPGGSGELASLGQGARRYAIGWPAPLPEPRLEGTTATYPDVEPGIDLVLTATRGGFEQSFVVRERPIRPISFRLPLTLTGLSFGRGPGGEIRLTDASGRLAARGPAPVMYDASVDRAGERTRQRPLSVAVTRRPGAAEMTISPDPAWLADPATTYPVVLDPATTFARSSDTYVESGGSATTNFNGATELRIGARNTASGVVAMRSFSTFNVNSLAGKHVLSAKVKVWNWQANSCTANATYLARVSGAWNPSTVTWNSGQPTVATPAVASTSAIYGYTGCLTANWMEYAGTGVRDMVQSWADGTTPNYGIRLHASETDTTSLRRLTSGEGTTGNPPALEVTYNSYPGVVGGRRAEPCFVACGDNGSVRSATPTLRGSAPDADGGLVRVHFEVLNASGTSVVVSGWSPWVASNTPTAWTVPTGYLSDGTSYRWRARAHDGTDYSAYSTQVSFAVDTTAPTMPGSYSTSFVEGEWSEAHGANGTFAMSGWNGEDHVAFFADLDQNPPTTQSATDEVSLQAVAEGRHTFYVQSVDEAGNRSAVNAYAFNVGDVAVTSPGIGDATAGKLTLDAVADPAYQELTWEWRRSDNDGWTTVSGLTTPNGTPTGPALDVVLGDVPTVVWDAGAAVVDDGPFQLRANVGTGVTSQPMPLRLDRTLAAAAATAVGPVTVNLLTGNATLSETDVSVDAYGSDLSVSRTHNSRAPQAAATGPFGPGWVSSAVVESADSDYTSLVVTGKLVTIQLADGDTVAFTESGSAYIPEYGAEGMKLAKVTGSDAYDLTEVDGVVTGFTKPNGSPDYRPTAVKQPGDSAATTYAYETIDTDPSAAVVNVTRVTRMMAPQPSTDVTCSTADPAVRGCRSLVFTYAPNDQAAPGDTAQTWGPYANRLVSVGLTAWDPDASPAAVVTVTLAAYSYDSAGRLRAAWDHRLPSLKTTYAYDAEGHVTTVTPPGEEPWTLTYGSIVGDPGTGRLKTVSRTALAAGTARWTLVYLVKVSGTGAPHDLSLAQLARWGQVDHPLDATAIIPPAETANPQTSLERATVYYLNADGRAVNVAQPGGAIATTEYDARGNVVRSLSAGNRQRALEVAGDSASVEAATAATLSTVSRYSADGVDLLESFGPEHEVRLANGTPVRARAHTVNTYDEGAPGGARYHLVTTSTSTARVVGETTDRASEARVSKTQYATSADWDRRSPTATITDAVSGGLNLTSRTAYNTDGLVIKTTLPGGTSAQDSAHTTRTVYYTAGTNSVDAACGGRAEWVNLVCVTRPEAQPATTSSRPAIPAKYVTYDMFNQMRVVTEKAPDGTVVRTTDTKYDAAGRVERVATTAAAGAALPVYETYYDPTSGRATQARSRDASTNALLASVTRSYDSLGRILSYTDSDGGITTTTYDVASRPVTTTTATAGNAARGTRTRYYDDGTERRGLLTRVVEQVGAYSGTFTTSYDVDGSVSSSTYPNGLVATTTYDETGSAASLAYVQTTGCTGTECQWWSEAVAEDVHGQWRTRTGDGAEQKFEYDKVGRLTRVEEIVGGRCTVRTYALDADSNRSSLATYAPAGDGTCQTSSSTARTYEYDEADRLKDAGYEYDALGRTTTVPAADAGGSALTATYQVNDLVASLTQGQSTTTWVLDVDQQRIRSWSVGAVTRTNHYDGDSDSPAWVDEGTGWTRHLTSPAGALAAVYDSVSDTATLHLTNLHGDIAATVASSGSGLAQSYGYTEFGAPRSSAPGRYGWVGGSMRSSEAVAGVVLMGVRLYNPATGRFLQVDPVPGGSDNAYDYAGHDPINGFDLDGRKKCKGWKKWACAIAKVASYVSYVPGPVGQWGAGVAAVGYAVGGDMARAADEAWGIIPGGKYAKRGKNAVRAAGKYRALPREVMSRTREQAVKKAKRFARNHPRRCAYRGPCRTGGQHVHVDVDGGWQSGGWTIHYRWKTE